MNKLLVLLLGLVLLFPHRVIALDLPARPSGFVSDFAKLLSESERADLETRLYNLEKSTGAEVAVVTVPDLQGTTIEDYAVKLFESWGIGKKGQNNGLLLLVALNERKVRIEVGYGLEPVVTDAESSWIIRDILTPAFREGNYTAGILGAVGRFEELIGQGATPRTEAPNDGEGIGIGIIFALFFGMQFVYQLLASTRSWWLGGILGGAIGLIIGLIYGFFMMGLIALLMLVPLGLVVDYLLSKRGLTLGPSRSGSPWYWGGGSSGSSRSGGGFGGFGGGRSGGGGSSGGW